MSGAVDRLTELSFLPSLNLAPEIVQANKALLTPIVAYAPEYSGIIPSHHTAAQRALSNRNWLIVDISAHELERLQNGSRFSFQGTVAANFLESHDQAHLLCLPERVDQLALGERYGIPRQVLLLYLLTRELPNLVRDRFENIYVDHPERILPALTANLQLISNAQQYETETVLRKYLTAAFAHKRNLYEEFVASRNQFARIARWYMYQLIDRERGVRLLGRYFQGVTFRKDIGILVDRVHASNIVDIVNGKGLGTMPRWDEFVNEDVPATFSAALQFPREVLEAKN
jgi:hypothetical protein